MAAQAIRTIRIGARRSEESQIPILAYVPVKGVGRVDESEKGAEIQQLLVVISSTLSIERWVIHTAAGKYSFH